MNVVSYAVKRAGKIVATAVVLPNGKCVVAWPTSTIVYDSEQAARDVHIRHMGGHGEPTTFEVDLASPAFMRGWATCYQDRCEGVPDGSGPRAPRYVPEADAADYEAGYLAMSKWMYGEDYAPDLSKWQGAIAAEVSYVHASSGHVDGSTFCGIPFDPRIKRSQRGATCPACLAVIAAADETSSAPEVQ